VTVQGLALPTMCRPHVPTGLDCRRRRCRPALIRDKKNGQGQRHIRPTACAENGLMRRTYMCGPDSNSALPSGFTSAAGAKRVCGSRSAVTRLDPDLTPFLASF